MMTAGSPGVTCRSANTARATTPMTGMMASRRRKTSASTRLSRQAIDTFQNNGAMNFRMPVTFFRCAVGEGDLLNLLGQLLAPGELGRPYEFRDQLLELGDVRPAEPGRGSSGHTP